MSAPCWKCTFSKRQQIMKPAHVVICAQILYLLIKQKVGGKRWRLDNYGNDFFKSMCVGGGRDDGFQYQAIHYSWSAMSFTLDILAEDILKQSVGLVVGGRGALVGWR